MSFLFKSKPKNQPANPINALPPVSRDTRSSDGLGSQSQIPTLNGGSLLAKPQSPTPGAIANGPLHSLAGNEVAVRPGTRTGEDRGGLMGSVPPSPDHIFAAPGRTVSSVAARPGQMPTRAPADPSPYPWSSRQLNFTVSHTNPFPRYGAAVNATAGKDGSVYLMGGLINGSTVKGDLWMVEAGTANMSCFPVATTSKGPGPRVGHASLLVGNAFIVFGGDTKMDEGDQLDDTLYLLNTCESTLPARSRRASPLTRSSS